MANETTARKPLRPLKAGEIRQPDPDAEAKLRAIAEAQGVVLDGKAWERVLAALKNLPGVSNEEAEQFAELLNQLRKTP